MPRVRRAAGRRKRGTGKQGEDARSTEPPAADKGRRLVQTAKGAMPEGQMRDAAMAGAVAIQAVGLAPKVAERLITDQLGLDWDERALVRFAVEHQMTACLALRDVALRGFTRAKPEVTAAAAQIVALRRPLRVRGVLAAMNLTPNGFLSRPDSVPWEGRPVVGGGSRSPAEPVDRRRRDS